MKTIEIRKVDSTEINLLQDIGKRTFLETFSESNSQQNMEKYLEGEFTVEKLTSEYNNKDSEFYFAVLETRILGYLKINFGRAQTERMDSSDLEIERIYVLQEFHGKKVGQLLYEKAIAIAKQKSARYVWLGVWEENLRAISFYTKNGFTAFGKHIFKLGDDEQTDIMMKLALE